MFTPDANKLMAPPSWVAPLPVKMSFVMFVLPESLSTNIAPPLAAWLSVKFEFSIAMLSATMSIAPPNSLAAFPVKTELLMSELSLPSAM